MITIEEFDGVKIPDEWYEEKEDAVDVTDYISMGIVVHTETNQTAK